MSREVAGRRVIVTHAGLERMRSRAGVTLVELLVAACVSAVALTGAWAWVWNAGAAANGSAGRAQASTAAAFAVRAVADEIGLATSLSCPPAGMSPDRALRLEHRHEGVPTEIVMLAWDPARRVLWRKAPGTYLADHVESFVVAYFRADGVRLGPADFAAAGWPQVVARIAITVDVTVGGRTARAGCCIALARQAVT